MQVQNQHSGKPNALPCVQTPVSRCGFLVIFFRDVIKEIPLIWNQLFRYFFIWLN